MWGTDFTRRALGSFKAPWNPPPASIVVHIASHGKKFGIINGASEPLNARELSDFINKLGNVKLIMMNACDTAAPAEGDPSSYALDVHFATGVPIIASAWKLDDSFASSFANSFYTALAQPGTDAGQAFKATVHSYAQKPPYFYPIYWGAYLTFGF